MNLEGKVAVITGASSGIGRATALALSGAGAKVVLAARRKERLNALEQEINGDCLTVVTDVTRRDDVKRMVQKAVDRFGKVDILINNAGVMLLSHLEQLAVDEWDRMIDVNIKGVLYGVAAVLPTMKEQRAGHIVNVASTAGHRVFPAGSVYCGTKFAVRAISEGLRQELSPDLGVRVTIISPGVVDTELSHHISDDKIRKKFAPGTAVSQSLTSEDIAEAILYAVSRPRHVNVNEVLVRPTEQPT